jgi:hypothetical protein
MERRERVVNQKITAEHSAEVEETTFGAVQIVVEPKREKAERASRRRREVEEQSRAGEI